MKSLWNGAPARFILFVGIAGFAVAQKAPVCPPGDKSCSPLIRAPRTSAPTICDGGELPLGDGDDLEVVGACTAKAGTFRYGNVNIYKGGSLKFSDAKIDFWARSILVEKDSSLLAGSPASPIGTNNGQLTIHLYGRNQGLGGRGITCKTDNQCGVDNDRWTSAGSKKVDLPGGVNDYFYSYDPIAYDDGDANGYFGYKVLAVSYGGTLGLYGRKGATFGDLPESSSGRSWTRLNKSIVVGDRELSLDGAMDWSVGDRIVVTTTDYLPGHSEELTIQAISVSGIGTTVTVNEAVKYPHNGEAFDLNGLPAGVGPDPINGRRSAETRAAVALLSRSIRIVSEGDELGDPFPAESTGYYFGGHTIVRQGFQSLQLYGVEFYQLGQGGRIGHYPIHFHVARTTSQNTTIADCSIDDSMTRWITLHGTHGITLQRNVGYKSIGHGFYLEDGTEINNRFYSNIGILARAAVDNVQNPRKVPGILANPGYATGEQVPFFSDVDHPTIFWITNGYNEFAYNMAAGAGTCGACYWLLPAENSGHSMHQKWEGYAAMQTAGRAAMTPLKRFEGNYCTSAMNSFNTIGNSTACLGVTSPDEPKLKSLPNPNPLDISDYPKIDPGGGRFATYCAEGTDCSTVPKCNSGTTDNCMVTVIDRYTSSFNWAETNFSAIWLRPQWYLFLNSVVTDVQNGGLTFVTGGGYTKSDIVDGHWALAKKNAFIGNAQDMIRNPFASHAGPFNPKSGLLCATQPNGVYVGNYCLSKDDGISMPMSNFGVNQRLFNIYDGPAYQESNAYLNVSRTTLEDCKAHPDGGICPDSKYMYAKMIAIPKDSMDNCYLPNASIAWKQPNGFYYPPAFHSRNLFFKDTEIRHYVIQPLFLPGSYRTDPTESAKRYCNWNDAMFNNFTDIDRQTELSDNDGSLTGLVNTVSVNQDPFFRAPVATPECASDVPENMPPSGLGTATTSPYDYVSTAIVPEFNYGRPSTWAQDCATPACYGVPLYRQYKLPSEENPVSIRMAGQSTAQRSSLTVNNGSYYIDTTVDMGKQQAAGPNLSIFEKNQTYYTFLLFAKPTTKQIYRMYVGPGFDVSSGVFMARANTGTAPVKFVRSAWPATWQREYDAKTGLLKVTLDMSFSEFKVNYDAAVSGKCMPKKFCAWKKETNSCDSALDKTDSLYDESKAVCSTWPVKDIDCPDGGCYSFGVTLPDGFTIGDKPNLPPPAESFPAIPEWNMPFKSAAESVSGKQCYYPNPPTGPGLH